VLLKKQLKDKGGNSTGPSSEELRALQNKYEESLQDLKQVKENLQKLETLAKDLKLKTPETVSEG
jgi:flagellar motility protein MotE (MotC chaperone)